MSNDLWQWFDDREHEYDAKGDDARLQMALVRHQAAALSETDPAAMVHLYRRGRDLARQLSEPWWVFFYDVWMEIAYETHARDLQSGLQQALHCVNEARNPILKDHPWRLAAYNNLLGCYVQIDPVGYAPAIRECLRQLDKEIAPGPNDHRYVMMDQHCEFLMAVGHLKQAEKLALRYQALVDQDRQRDPWYLLHPLLDFCWIGFRQQDWQKVKSYAEESERVARSDENNQLGVAEAQMWQALVARKTGDEGSAKRLFRSSVNRSSRVEKEPAPEHYDAIAGFHEAGGNLDKALEVRDKQLTHMAGKGRFGYECETLIKRCELLARLGQLTEKDLDRVQVSMRPLKNPKPYQARLEPLQKQGI